METKLKIDVWHLENSREPILCSTISEGKSTMRKLRKEGKTEIRMYVDYSEDKRFYYSFNLEGKIIKEDNTFNN